MHFRKLISIALFCAILPYQAFSDTSDGPKIYKFLDRPFMELVGFIEAPAGYNDITGFTNRKPVKDVTEMTIDEVLDFQRMLRQKGTESSAMGRFQFVYKTLNYVTDKHNIDRNALFDEEMQDRLARMEMERCGFYDPKTDITELGNCLAATWAALPLLSGTERGRSRYASTGINGARTTPEIVEAVLKARYFTRKITPQPKKKPNGFRVISASFELPGRKSGSTTQKPAKAINTPAEDSPARPKIRPETVSAD